MKEPQPSRLPSARVEIAGAWRRRDRSEPEAVGRRAVERDVRLVGGAAATESEIANPRAIPFATRS
jgi:hypothetical protein